MPSALALKRRQIKQRLVGVARAQLGYSESPPGSNRTKYGSWYGLNGVSWCGEFVSWVAAHGGCASIIPKYAYTPAGAAWFRARGQFGPHPRVGAIAFYDLSGLGRISHTGIVEKVFPDGSFYAIEGNTNNTGAREGTSVLRQHRTKVGPLGGFGLPDYTALARRELAT